MQIYAWRYLLACRQRCRESSGICKAGKCHCNSCWKLWQNHYPDSGEWFELYKQNAYYKREWSIRSDFQKSTTAVLDDIMAAHFFWNCWGIFGFSMRLPISWKPAPSLSAFSISIRSLSVKWAFFAMMIFSHFLTAIPATFSAKISLYIKWRYPLSPEV